MYISRFELPNEAGTLIGAIDDDAETITEIETEGNSLEELLLAGESWDSLRKNIDGQINRLEEVRLRAPISRPLNLIGIGLNYAGHAEEGGFDIPEEPIFFAKSPSSITDPDSAVVRHDGVTDLHYEGEVGFVIGTRCEGVDAEDALDHVFGVLPGNDVTARDLQLRDLEAGNPWYRSKSMDTFTPLGPVTPLSEASHPGEIGIETRLNSDVVQSSNTSDLIFDIEEILAHVSQYVTLHPGDVVLTGTPAGVGTMEPDDTVEVDIDDTVTLSNTVNRP